jgi:mono/diheme cytochrome c family protein
MTLITRNTASPSGRRHGGGNRQLWIAAAFAAAFLLLLAVGSSIGRAQRKQNAAAPAANANDAALVARGKYIVEDVAYCTNCHTPRDDDGNLERSQWLMGAPVFLQPARPMSDWPEVEPRLAGQPPATDAQMIRLLTTGIWTTGQHLRQPMPQFRMTPEDAAAVVAYLKSL